MKNHLGRRGIRLLLITTGLLAVAAGIAYAQIPDSSGVIHACYQSNTGSLRVIGTNPTVGNNRCNANEKALSWNQTGPKGATGANGVDGAKGATGANGVTGVTGATGANGLNGAKGATGANGVTGATGATGANGVNGVNGAKGATGPSGVSGIHTVTGSSVDITADGAGTSTATCASGESALGGGYNTLTIASSGDPFDPQAGLSGFYIYSIGPTDAGNGWTVKGQNPVENVLDPTDYFTVRLTAKAVCAKTG